MAAKEYVVETVEEYHPNPEMPCWRIYSRMPDGNLHGYVFPQNTLEWRAAEYGIDPDDVETLLDVVLHEPHLARVDRDDPALKQGRVSPAVTAEGNSRVGELVPTTLYNAETVKDAREAHLVRVQHAKQNRVSVVPPKGKPDPLDVIRQKYRNRVSRVDEKRKLVEEIRQDYQKQLTAVLSKRDGKES